MSYNFNPLSDEELDAINMVEPGRYNFEVIKDTKKMSKSNNPMAELLLKVWDKTGKTHTVFDYLVFSNVNLNIRKVKHFADTAGLQEEYKKGQFPESLTGLCGEVDIDIQDEQPKPSGGFYPKKNYVVDYATQSKYVKQANDSKGHADLPFEDDDVPF